MVSFRIDEKGVVKVADFGLTEDMYCRNYFRRDNNETGGGEKLPIRWMAPESIKNDIFNEATDVVNYTWFPWNINVAMILIILVVIWSDNVGDIYMWAGAICWNTCNGHCFRAAEGNNPRDA